MALLEQENKAQNDKITALEKEVKQLRQGSQDACKVLKINFTTIPNIIIRMYQKNIITKSQAQAYIIKLEKIGRYKKEIIEKVKEDIKNE